jgi:hypothetical protein
VEDDGGSIGLFFVLFPHIQKKPAQFSTTMWILQKRRHQLTEENFSTVYDMFMKVADESMNDPKPPKEVKLIDLD